MLCMENCWLKYCVSGVRKPWSPLGFLYLFLAICFPLQQQYFFQSRLPAMWWPPVGRLGFSRSSWKWLKHLPNFTTCKQCNNMEWRSISSACFYLRKNKPWKIKWKIIYLIKRLCLEHYCPCTSDLPCSLLFFGAVLPESRLSGTKWSEAQDAVQDVDILRNMYLHE